MRAGMPAGAKSRLRERPGAKRLVRGAVPRESERGKGFCDQISSGYLNILVFLKD